MPPSSKIEITPGGELPEGGILVFVRFNGVEN